MREMTRREFFAESAGLVLSAGLLRNFQLKKVSKKVYSYASSQSDLIVAHNGTPGELLVAALNKYGGIGKVVKKGEKVVIKVNMSFNRTPQQAATTNPELVETLVRLCREAGAREVLVLDHTLDNGKMCMNSTGMKDAVERARGKIKVTDSERDYREVDIPQGKTLKKTLFSKDILDADVFINVPIAKVHSSATTTLSMKNLMGTVWDRGEFHWRGLHQCIADLSTFVKPDLIILDAYRILMTNGPGGPGEVKDAGEVVVGTDPVAVDVYGSVLLEKDPDAIRYIKMAADLGIGQKDMDRINTVYVDAQKAVGEAEEAEEVQEEAQEETPEPEPVGEEPVSEETPGPEVSEEEEPVIIGEEEEKEAGIPAVILVMAGIVSFLIGLRMRRMKKKEEVE